MVAVIPSTPASLASAEFCTNRIGARGRGLCLRRTLVLKGVLNETVSDHLLRHLLLLLRSRSQPDASLKGIHQAIYGLHGQISVRSASSNLVSNFSDSFSSDYGSRHGAVRPTGLVGQGPHRSSVGHAAAAAAAGICAAGKSIVKISEPDDRAVHLGQSSYIPREGEAKGREPSV